MWGERMSKMRIYEYAREKNVSSKEVIDELLKMEIEVASHMSSIDLEEQIKLDDVFNTETSEEKQEEKKKAPKVSKKQVEKQKKVMKQPTKKQQPKMKKSKSDQSNVQEKQQTGKSEIEQLNHLVYSGTLTVDELANRIEKDVSEIIKKLMFLGVMATKNQDL